MNVQKPKVFLLTPWPGALSLDFTRSHLYLGEGSNPPTPALRIDSHRELRVDTVAHLQLKGRLPNNVLLKVSPLLFIVTRYLFAESTDGHGRHHVHKVKQATLLFFLFRFFCPFSPFPFSPTHPFTCFSSHLSIQLENLQASNALMTRF